MIMWLLILAVFLVIVFAAILLAGGPEAEVADNYFNNIYKEDIDFSLMVKGYPVVNDVDIQYTEWLAANPGKIM